MPMQERDSSAVPEADQVSTRRTFIKQASVAGAVAMGLAATKTASSADPAAAPTPPAPADPVEQARRIRLAIRKGQWRGPSGGKVPECVVCNLVVLPKSLAYDFLLYCVRNPKPCPIVEVCDPGKPEPVRSAPGADLRTDLARYAIYRNGVRGEDAADIRDLWRDDSVAFLIGSSLTFDHALQRAGVPPSKEVWVVNTTIQTTPAGIFRGPMVATMRWMTPAQAVIASQLTGRFPFNHGAPIHLGDPAEIGADLDHPIYGEPVKEIPRGVMPVFWACGVTPQSAAIEAKCPLMIAHAPAHGFISDLQADRICIP
jgi:uncharacterized protein YcsI (UPF0317 family)